MMYASTKMNSVKNIVVSIPNIRSDIDMEFIVWNRDNIPITPMEYFEYENPRYAVSISKPSHPFGASLDLSVITRDVCA